MPRALIGPAGARGGENAPSRHMSPLLQVPRALTQGGDSSAEQGWGRQDQRAQHPSWGQNNRTAGTTATPQPRATGAEGPDMAGTGRFPAGAKGPDTGGRAQQARVLDNWQHTATPRNTPRRQPIPLPAPNIIKQAPVVFHKSSVGLNEGGQRLSATPLTSPTELPPASGTAAEMDTGHIPQSSIQWAHHCPALCRQGRPNFLRQLSSCQLPAPLQHGGGSRHPTIGTKREP